MGECAFMKSIRAAVLVGTIVAGGASFLAAFPIWKSFAVAAETESGAHRATLDQYCIACHNGAALTAGLNLEAANIAHPGTSGEVWEKVVRKLRTRAMPPAGMPRPDDKTYNTLVAYLEKTLDSHAKANPNPGTPTLHRLNRAEYANAVRDMMALEVDVAALLPTDEIGYGFDNVGDTLNFSPLLLDRYLAASRKISRLAVPDSAMQADVKTYDVPRGLVQTAYMGEDMPFGSRGGAKIIHQFPVDGEYEISVALQVGKDDEILGLERERKLDLSIDGKRVGEFTIAADERAKIVLSGNGATYSPDVRADAHLKLRVPVKAGARTITATFQKDTIIPEGILRKSALYNVADSFFAEGVGKISVAGPQKVHGVGTSASRKKIFICYPSQAAEERACAEKILSSLARKAYRRPIVAADLPPLMKFYQLGAQNGGFEGGVRLAVQKILVSPEFLFRFERDRPGAVAGGVYPVGDIELASRLSFFLWSTIPDDELLALAERGELSKPKILDAQVKRMLKDERSKALVTNFAGQWLYLRNVDKVQPDPFAFPNFDENLRKAMQKETELVVTEFLRQDRSIVDILDTDYTYLNQRLAEHYGVKGIYGAEFRRVAVEDERRRGLMGQASILTVTSYPNRTAPTIRGKWVLGQILGTPPPPPPPDIPSLNEDVKSQKMTMRERMEQHRTNPVCASCHKMMDPLGFALENFDGLGRWREVTGHSKIDASGEMPDGTKFSGPSGLRGILLSKRDAFLETFTERLLTYALGRGVEHYDQPAIREIVRESADDNHSWSAIILEIVRSAPFQQRKVVKA